MREAVAWIPIIADVAMSMPTARRHLPRQLVESLPRESGTRPARVPKEYEHHGPGFGAALVRMLHVRNLAWTGGAKAMLAVANIPLSAATVGAIGHGRKKLTPELLTGFAQVLGISTGLLSALTSIELPDDVRPAADAASLIWEMRSLTADQVRQIYHEAKYDRNKLGP